MPTSDVVQLWAAEAGLQEQLYERMSWMGEKKSRVIEQLSRLSEQRLRRQVLQPGLALVTHKDWGKYLCVPSESRSTKPDNGFVFNCALIITITA